MTTYREAGVDIDAGDALVDRIAPLAARTRTPGVVAGVGGFAGLFSLLGRYRDPLLVSGTDGVGTKLLLAQAVGRHTTIGIDLVAMCVNDVITCGADPLFFLDYFATGRLDVDAAEQVISGIAAGCTEAGCALLGGETAEMPGMYAPGHYDLAGFCVGAVERSELLDGSRVRAGDRVVGVPSSGVHSNGYSLVRRVVALSGLPWNAEPAGLDGPLDEVLLRPTVLYPRAMATARAHGVKAAAHITGGGLEGNLPRVLPSGVGAHLVRSSWPVPPVFTWLQRTGDVPQADLWLTFNMGIGFCAVFEADAAESAATAMGGHVIGEIVPGDGVHFT